MSEEQSSPVTAPAAPQPGIFGTKIPSSVAFGIGVLLFFMPFVDIKCNTMVLQKVSGVQLATGFEIESSGSDESLLGGLDKMDKSDGKVNGREKRDPNMFALAALILGVIAFILAVIDKKGTASGGVIAGALAAGSLIGALIDIKRKVKLDMSDITNRARDRGDLDRFGDSMYISVDFTPWFYISVIGFVVGAWFCYKKMQVK